MAGGSHAVRSILCKGSKEQRACLQVLSVKSSKQEFLFSYTCALMYIYTFTYKTFPVSVQGSILFKS